MGKPTTTRVKCVCVFPSSKYSLTLAHRLESKLPLQRRFLFQGNHSRWSHRMLVHHWPVTLTLAATGVASFSGEAAKSKRVLPSWWRRLAETSLMLVRLQAAGFGAKLAREAASPGAAAVRGNRGRKIFSLEWLSSPRKGCRFWWRQPSNSQSSDAANGGALVRRCATVQLSHGWFQSRCCFLSGPRDVRSLEPDETGNDDG